MLTWCLDTVSAHDVESDVLLLARAVTTLAASKDVDVIAIQGVHENLDAAPQKVRFGALISRSMKELGCGDWQTDDSVFTALSSPSRSVSTARSRTG